MADWNLLTAARTLAQEARGEPLEGQQAVAQVLLNRIKDGRWGKTLGSVCLWRAQFSGWYSPRNANGKVYLDPNFAYACDLLDDDPMITHMLGVLQTVMNSPNDPTDGATHYFNPSLVHPPWAAGATPCGQFGNQVFFKGVK